MKNFRVILLCAFVAALAESCSKSGGDDDFPGNPVEVSDGSLSHGEIILGEQLENPYSLENVKCACKSLYPTKSFDGLQATNLYVRFLPKDSDEMNLLESLSLELLDYPVDYEILQDGDYYKDPSISEDAITWQYAVVPSDFVFPDIEYQILENCFITDSSSGTRSGIQDVDWEAVERKAFDLTGNGDMVSDCSVKGSSNPSGRITMVDEEYGGGQKVGVAGVRVECNVFVKFSSTYTDRDGYYTIPRKFSANPRYRLVFKNSKGFSIGFNWILYPASISTLGESSPSGINYNVDKDSGRTIFRRCVVNNSAYDFFERCSSSDLGITAPPSNLCFWTFDSTDASSAVMLHHGTVLDGDSTNWIYKLVSYVVGFFAPDITIGAEGLENYKEISAVVCHEMAHASHFVSVGKDYWDDLVHYIVQCAVRGQDLYGDGTLENAGVCAVAEMWAFYLQSKMYKERYGGTNPAFGSSYWFHPQILTYLEDRGMTAGEIFAALTSDVTSVDLLREKLLTLYPARKSIITQVFNRYE